MENVNGKTINLYTNITYICITIVTYSVYMSIKLYRMNNLQT